MSMTLDEALAAHGGAVQRVRALEEELRHAQPATKADIDAILASLADLKVLVRASTAPIVQSSEVLAFELAEHRRSLPAIAVRAVHEARRNNHWLR
ncbi:hypothetical protein [Azorhizobium doebereinerae]|uniref:hypothetical protein n=1 Tax=Azorhizobium doebereinerae TaxID=281091 RepID=UPI0003F4CEB7|nr:hypothetical protein [Azorhizobium doebereinerae]